MAARWTLGIDLGTSAVKVAALAADEAVQGEGVAEFDTAASVPNQAEQAPEDWLAATGRAMKMLAAALAPRAADWTRSIGAIGLTGQLPTLVCLGERGPVAPAITWKDGRADEWAAGRVRRGEHYGRTGMPIDGRYLAPMWQFHFSDRAGEVGSVLSAKDFLLYALTGLRITEPSTAAGYGVYDLQERSFAKDLCEFWNLPQKLLPRLQPANSFAGPLSEAGAALLGLPAGIPVSCGAADSVCAAYAMAALDEHVVSISFGSSAVILAASATRRLDPAARYLLTPHVEPGWYGREMDLLSSGTGYQWLRGLFGWSEGEIDLEAAASVAGARGLSFAPYLAGGEQGALWNPRLQGGLFGLTLSHSRADIARAYLEGVFFEVKRCVEVLAETLPIESLRVGGRIVQAPASIQMLADILGYPVAEVRDQSPAAIGAALLARRILRKGVAEGRRCAALKITRPDPPTADGYRALYAAYLARAAKCG
jgi:xylulokinase